MDRISINPQTMKDDTLKLIGRAHSVEDTKKAFEMAREEGISNINMDISLGVNFSPSRLRFIRSAYTFLILER